MGTTKVKRKKTIDKAGIGLYPILPLFCLSILAYFFPDSVTLILLLTLTLPFLVIYCIFHPNSEMMHNFGRRHGLINLHSCSWILVAVLAMRIQLSNSTLLFSSRDYWNVAGLAFAFGLILLGILAVGIRSLATVKWLLLPFAAFMYFAILTHNVLLDANKTPYSTVILRKWSSGGRNSTYYVAVTPWRENLPGLRWTGDGTTPESAGVQAFDFSLRWTDYQNIPLKPLIVCEGQGLFGLHWARLSATAESCH